MASEGQRQADLAAAQALHGNRQGDEPASTQAASVKAAEIAHWQRVLSSALASGGAVSPVPALTALRELGVPQWS